MKYLLKSALLASTLLFIMPLGHADDETPTAQTYDTGITYRGVNLSGAEFENGQDGDFIPTPYDAQLFIYRGMNVARVPVSWEYLADEQGNIDTSSAYFTTLKSTIDGLVSQKMHVVIDVHNYMRYNPTNVSLDYENTSFDGTDVIGVGSAAPSAADYANLWSNIVKQFHGDTIIYGLMNEPHDMSQSVLVNNYNTAIAAIRTEESALGATSHLLLVSGNNWSGIYSWDESVNSEASNSEVFPTELEDSANQFAFDVHEYFDDDGSHSGLYSNNQCMSTSNYESDFSSYWGQMLDWAKNNQAKLFIGEFGVPNTSVCFADAEYFLGQLGDSAYSSSQEYGVLGWSVWSAGHAWGSYILSIAPGGPVNEAMFDDNLYQTVLTPVADLPALGEPIAKLTNTSSETLSFNTGYWPFQLSGTADLSPGQTVYLYDPSDTLYQSSNGNIELSYNLGAIGFGVTSDGYGYSYGGISNASSCDIVGSNGDTNRCFMYTG